LEHNWVVFAFFKVLFFGAPVAITNSLVVAVVHGVTVLPRTTQMRLNGRRLLVGEGQVRSVRGEVRVEGATLPNIVAEGLVTVQNLAILLSVLSAALILCSFKRIFVILVAQMPVIERLGFSPRPNPDPLKGFMTTTKPETFNDRHLGDKYHEDPFERAQD
jgi:hypothetical protein